jgi:hypothetical protein
MRYKRRNRAGGLTGRSAAATKRQAWFADNDALDAHAAVSGESDGGVTLSVW